MKKLDTISGRRAFENVRRLGRVIRSPQPDGISAIFLEGGDLQVAFALHRSLGNAVKRNKLKRQMKAALAEINDRKLIREGSYLFRPRKAAMLFSYLEVKENLIQLTEAAAELQR